MFVMRRHHEMALGAVTYTRFKRQIAEHLRRHLPRQVDHLKDWQLRQCIDRACQTARGYGCCGERDLRIFCECVVLANDLLDNQSFRPDIVGLLTSDELDLSERLVKARKLAAVPL